ncbi:MAG: phytanoyl-CoA dioxygenase family protein [Capsulimonadaceae bacterium]|nr:phytanoyl-CoA dioxygenase family protein [Capsulimonadaceae bacterium]
MTSTLSEMRPASLSATEIARFHEDGYYIARGLFSPEEAALIRDAFMEQSKDGPVPGLSEIRGEYTKDDPLSYYPRMMFPADHPEFAVGPVAKQFMLDQRIYVILRDLMGEEPVAAQSMFYFKPPGARGQAMHQDNFYLRVKPGTCMAAWIAVDDADEENGGMCVIPGTHTMDVVCPAAADRDKYFTHDYVATPGKEPKAANMSAGDCLFFNGSLVHGSSPNSSTERFRRSLILHYVPESSIELSAGYGNPRRFDDTPVRIPPATGGGPCGGEVVPMGPH